MDIFDNNPNKLLVIILTLVFLVMYYLSPNGDSDRFLPFLYGQLENAYYQNYWTGGNNQTTQNALQDIQVTVHIPAYLSTVNDAELLVTVENKSKTEDWEGSIIVNLKEPNVDLLMRLINDDAIAIQGKNEIVFAPIAPQTSASQGVWIRIAPGGDKASFDSLDQINFTFSAIKHCEYTSQSETSDENSFQFNTSSNNGIAVFFFGQRGNENPSQLITPSNCDNTPKTFTPRSSTQATIDSNKTIIQSLVKKVLLPPWSNGFLFVLALAESGLIVWVVENKRRPYKKTSCMYRVASTHDKPDKPSWVFRLLLYLAYIFLAIYLLHNGVQSVTSYLKTPEQVSIVREIGGPLIWPVVLAWIVYLGTWLLPGFIEFPDDEETNKQEKDVSVLNCLKEKAASFFLKVRVWSEYKRFNYHKSKKRENNHLTEVDCQQLLVKYQEEIQKYQKAWRAFQTTSEVENRKRYELLQAFRQLDKLARETEPKFKSFKKFACYKDLKKTQLNARALIERNRAYCENMCQELLTEYQERIQKQQRLWEYYAQSLLREKDVWADLDGVPIAEEGDLSTPKGKNTLADQEGEQEIALTTQIRESFNNLNRIVIEIEQLLGETYSSDSIYCAELINVYREAVIFLNNIEERFKTLLLPRKGQQLVWNIEILNKLLGVNKNDGPLVNYYQSASLEEAKKKTMPADEALIVAHGQLLNYWEREVNECLTLIDEGEAKDDPAKIENAQKKYQSLAGKKNTAWLEIDFPEKLGQKMGARLQEVQPNYEAMKNKEIAGAIERGNFKEAYEHLDLASQTYRNSSAWEEICDQLHEKVSECINGILDQPEHTKEDLDKAESLLYDGWLISQFGERIQKLRDTLQQ